MKEPIPDSLPAGGLIENRDGIVGAFYDDLEALSRRYTGKLSRIEIVGVMEMWKLRLFDLWKQMDAKEDE